MAASLPNGGIFSIWRLFFSMLRNFSRSLLMSAFKTGFSG
jgi:hypothetical protein